MAEWVGKCLLKCSQWIMHESDTLEDIRIKRGFTPVAVLTSLFCLFLLVQELANPQPNVSYLLALICGLAGSCVFFVRGGFGMRMRYALDLVIPLFTLAVLLADLANASEGRLRAW
eukprot:Hpha_TRINITY_DN9437_c0_g3::TRINITY_DN9437_c0_g3_i1::g.139164::m.139164